MSDSQLPLSSIKTSKFPSSSKGNAEASVRNRRNPWNDPARAELYPIPAPNDLQWSVIRQQPTAADARIRLLRSHNTLGQIISLLGDDGVDRITDWSYLPDLQFWRPVEYFISHPHITAVWIETQDDDSYSASSGQSDPGDVVTVGGSVASAGSRPAARSAARLPADADRHDPSSDSVSVSSISSARPLAIVVRRSEMSYELATMFRTLQHYHFTRHGQYPPPCDEFTVTLHGR